MLISRETGLVRKEKRATGAAPLSIAPDQLWYGNDGPWSAFMLGYGTPAQYVKSYISTSTPQPYVVLSEGCTSTDPRDCTTARGGIYYPNASSTWQNLGDFTLGFEENLGIYENGEFAFDSVALGIPGSGAPTLDNQVVVGIAAKQFFLGTWGIHPAPTNLSTLNDPIPSIVQNLKDEGTIPSLSWGYTAGAYYQSKVNKNGEGSLTLGGYDASRFEDSKTTFSFAPDTSRDLVVAIRAIVTSGGSTSLLLNPILSFIDSAVSHIWLPAEACDAFQQAFGLTYDEDLGLYLVNSTVHDDLVAQNATISFTLSNDLTLGTSSSLVTIDMPYSAFDLQLTPDYPNNSNNATYYFPIRQAANESQYTLGRTFLQQAYVIADYERQQFSVHQALFPGTGVQQSLQAIEPPSNSSGTSNTTSATPVASPASSGSSLSTGALAGIIVAAVVAVAIMLGGYLTYRWRKRKRAAGEGGAGAGAGADAGPLELKSPSPPPLPSELLAEQGKLKHIFSSSELPAKAVPTPELPDQRDAGLRRPELAGDEAARELDADRRHARNQQVWELPA